MSEFIFVRKITRSGTILVNKDFQTKLLSRKLVYVILLKF